MNTGRTAGDRIEHNHSSRLAAICGKLLLAGALVMACSDSGGGSVDGSLGSGGTGSGGGTGVPGSGGTAGAVGSGGSGAGGAVGSGGSGSGGAAGSGGASGAGGAAGAGAGGAVGSGGASGSGGGGGLPLKNPPVPSVGCGSAPKMTTGSKTIVSSGDTRHYNITIPSSYNMNKAYRVIYASHGLGGDGDDITRENYYGLKPVADAANEPAIFIAPTGLNGAWGQKDHPLFDDILALVKQSLCVDTSRVFVLGFSFGGMYTYSLSLNHQKVIRAAIGMGPANYNIWLPTNTHEPIAWMQTTGMSDGTTPWINGTSTTLGAKYIAFQHATDNGCTLPANIPTWKSGDPNPLVYDFLGCKPGYPVRVYTFNGGHGLAPGATNLMWAFITQF